MSIRSKSLSLLFAFGLVLTRPISSIAQDSDCQKRIEAISEKAKFILMKSRFTDISEDMSWLESESDKCKFDLKKIGFGGDVRKKLIDKGNSAELEAIKADIEIYSNFREVEPELEKLRKYASRSGVPDSLVDEFRNKYLPKGKQSAEAQKSKCETTVDLRSGFPERSYRAIADGKKNPNGDGIFEDIRTNGPRDQGEIGWCYAFSTADLLSYQLGKSISAADIAITYNDKLKNNLLKVLGRKESEFEFSRTDSVKVVVEKLKLAGGACLESKFKSEDNSNSDLISRLEEIDKIKRKKISPSDSSCVSDVRKAFPEIDAKDLVSIAENSTKADFIRKLRSHQCEPRLSLKDVEVVMTRSSFGKADKTAIFKQLDEHLNSGKVMSILYNLNLLNNKDARKINGHVSTVVGRRYNPQQGECEYLIRNTWGRSCEYYDRSYDCEEGNIWVPKSTLAKGVASAFHLK
jgi:hypothetical protein